MNKQMSEPFHTLMWKASIGYNDSWSQVDPKVLEKFAELIVLECARIARATPCPYEEEEVKQRLGHTWDMASLEAGRCISKHFGLEK